LTNDNRPAVSPDGSRIAFTSPRSGSNQIWVADLRTGETSQVTNLPHARLGHQIWSPDGERIVFIFFGAKGRDLMSVRVSDGRTRLLVADDEHEWPVGYSPDGRTFYYAKGPDSAKTLWSIDGAMGTPVKALDARAQGFGLNPAGGYVYKVEDRFYSQAGPAAEPAVLFSQQLWDTTSFVVANSGIYCLSNDHRLVYHGFDDGVTRILIRFPEPPRPGIAVSPNEDFVYVDMLSRRMQITVIEDIRGLF
jgi:dipeptidyl aminopeptidase/acylaminoacyl peptidase